MVANNGLAAVKFIRSIRSWAYKTFGNERTGTAWWRGGPGWWGLPPPGGVLSPSHSQPRPGRPWLRVATRVRGIPSPGGILLAQGAPRLPFLPARATPLPLLPRRPRLCATLPPIPHNLDPSSLPRTAAVKLIAMATPEDMRADAEHIRMADQFVEVPGGKNVNNYANVGLITSVAVRTGVDAVWPGW